MQTVLMFHGLGEPRPDIPAAEVPYWVAGSSFRDILAHVRQRHADKVVWTFDDGNRSDLEAAGELAAAGLHGKFFVLTGRIGTPHYLSAADLRELAGMGMEVGSHGRGHIDWRKADDKTLGQEILDTRAQLSDLIGRDVTSVAIPFGHYDRRVFARLSASPYARIYTSDTGPAPEGARFVRRNPVMAGHSARDIDAIVADRVPLSRRLRRTLAPILKRTVR